MNIKLSKLIIITLIVMTITSGCQSNLSKNNNGLEENNTISTESTTTNDLEILNSELDKIYESFEELSQILSISITQNGERIDETYFRHAKETTTNNIFSDTKSITSLLVGIAIDEGYIKSVDESIGEYVDLSGYENKEQLEEITIKHLLTMSAGLIWDSNDLSSEYYTLKNSKDSLDLILKREIVFTPGTNFNYSDGSSHLVSIIFSSATGMNLQTFAEEKLFTPLGIANVKWKADRDGNNYGGFDLYLSNEDMIKIGELVLNKGKFQDLQLVSEDWIDESTSYQINSDNRSTDCNKYGYYWWLGKKSDIKLIAAFGHGGQFIYVVPELDLVITASCYGAVDDSIAGNHFMHIKNAIVDEIIPLFFK